jgi:hypothetical protein
MCWGEAYWAWRGETFKAETDSNEHETRLHLKCLLSGGKSQGLKGKRPPAERSRLGGCPAWYLPVQYHLPLFVVEFVFLSELFRFLNASSA